MTRIAKSRPGIITSGRPPLTTSSSTLSSSTAKNVNARRKSAKATRTLINKHHQLQKARAIASANNDVNQVKHIDAQIEELGGLGAYQAASLTGQDRDRGGDSSSKLVEWLEHAGSLLTTSSDQKGTLRVLEVGALSSKNAISQAVKRENGHITRIDLKSQEPNNIQEIDFMDLAVPTSNEEKFDILSLSLVLNYVPSPLLRGKMLQKTAKFLRLPSSGSDHKLATEPSELMSVQTGEVEQYSGPYLFIVLPLSCLRNSRYMNESHLHSIMCSLGFTFSKSHFSTKLAYLLYSYKTLSDNVSRSFHKTELCPGKSRNNFAITLEAD